MEHLVDNLNSLSVSLSEEEIAEIEASYGFDHGFPHTFINGSRFTGAPSKMASNAQDVFLSKLSNNTDWVQHQSSLTKASKVRSYT